MERAFSPFVEIIELKIINDRETERSWGFSFVTFNNEKAMRDSIEGMKAQNLDGRNITINEAQSRGSGGTGGGGGNRGYSRGGGGGGYSGVVGYGGGGHNEGGEGTLVLIRHGEPLWNEKNLFTCYVDVPLSKKGVEEAIEAGKRISNILIDMIYTSALIRAQMTAMLAMTQHRRKKVWGITGS